MDKITRYNSDLLKWVTGKDNGREAWYLLLVKDSKEMNFHRDIGKKGTINLDHYGEVLESSFGKDATDFFKSQVRKLSSDPAICEANELLDKKKFRKAHQRFNELLKRNPEYVSCLESKAEAYFSQKLYKESLELYNKLIGLREGRITYRQSRAFIAHEAGLFDKALDDLNFCETIQKTNQTIYNNRAALHINMKNYDAAIADARKAIEIDKNFANPYRHLARANLKNGNKRGFIQNINKAIKLKPSYAAAYLDRGIYKNDMADIEKAYSILCNKEEIQQYLLENVADKAKRKDIMKKVEKMQPMVNIPPDISQEEKPQSNLVDVSKKREFCSICIEEFKEDNHAKFFNGDQKEFKKDQHVMLDCGHDEFHKGCISDYLNQFMKCPICQKPIKYKR